MTKICPLLEQEIKNLIITGDAPREVAHKLHIDPQIIYRRTRKWGLLSKKQKQIQEQLSLKKEKKRRCHVCLGIFQLSPDFFGFSNGVWRRRCRKCDNLSANKNYRKRMETRDLETAIRYKLYQAKYRSKEKRDFLLTVEDIKNQWEKQKGLCFYTGEPMVVSVNSPHGFSIDRYDSNLGYKKENVVLCSHVINLMKKDLSEKNFIRYCTAVASYKRPQSTGNMS